ncbi:hypothetical protein [Paludisphaera sp.]|uniref:hypothetical protein n=1 Tax=Paludisphaera sp. TaxID=2017432 RepID=UPI00301E5EBF
MLDSPLVDALPILRTPAEGGAPGRPVPGLLLAALKGLAGLEPSRSMVRGRRASRRYHDADFHYVEAAVPELDGVEADICIHDGRVYLRVAR